MSGRLEELAAEFGMVERALGDPEALADSREYARLTRRHRELLPLVTLLREQEGLAADLRGARELLADPGHAALTDTERETVFLAALLHDVAKCSTTVVGEDAWRAPRVPADDGWRAPQVPVAGAEAPAGAGPLRPPADDFADNPALRDWAQARS